MRRREITIADSGQAPTFVGLHIEDDGKIWRGPQSTTLDETSRNATSLRAELRRRNTHQEMLPYCAIELLKKNSFHAVLEATESVFEDFNRGRVLATTADPFARMLPGCDWTSRWPLRPIYGGLEFTWDGAVIAVVLAVIAITVSLLLPPPLVPVVGIVNMAAMRWSCGHGPNADGRDLVAALIVAAAAAATWLFRQLYRWWVSPRCDSCHFNVSRHGVRHGPQRPERAR